MTVNTITTVKLKFGCRFEYFSFVAEKTSAPINHSYSPPTENLPALCQD